MRNGHGVKKGKAAAPSATVAAAAVVVVVVVEVKKEIIAAVQSRSPLLNLIRKRQATRERKHHVVFRRPTSFNIGHPSSSQILNQ